MLAGVFGLLLSFCAGADAGASEAFSMYNHANSLYAAGEYQAARDRYLEVVAGGMEDAWLFYNLGNAWFKSGELGKAILWYERARRLEPRDPDILHNLRFAKTIKRDRDPEPGHRFYTAMARVLHHPTLDELSAAFSALLLALFLLGLVWLRRGRQMTSGWLAGVIVCSSLLLVNTVVLSARMYHHYTVTEAIVIYPQARARSGPDERQTPVFLVHEGTKVRIDRQQEDWLLIRLPNGLRGWLERRKVEEI